MNRLYSLYFFLISIWWAWTVLVDFVVLRTAFGIIDNFFLAGSLGMALFSKLNNLEVIVSSVIVGILAMKRSWKLLIVAVLLWVIAMVYFAYLTPKIISLTEVWKTLDTQGLAGTSDIPDIQQEHQYFHKLYIAIDTVKLLILSGLIGIEIFRKKV